MRTSGSWRFSEEERQEIARILELARYGENADEHLQALEKSIANYRERADKDKQDWLEFYRLRGSRGRPFGASVDAIGKTLFLARIYRGETGKQPKNSRSHPFFRLVQICLRQQDPSKLIAALTKPPWNEPRDFKKGLADAKALVRQAAAEGLKPDD